MVAEDDTDVLVGQARDGDPHARERLLDHCRSRLRRMVAARLDPRLAARVDPSDVVQETLAEADRKLDAYLRDVPLPFFPWLRRLAWERLAKLHYHHLQTGKRSLRREQQQPVGLSDDSLQQFADYLATTSGGPVQRLLRAELKGRVSARARKAPRARPRGAGHALSRRLVERRDRGVAFDQRSGRSRPPHQGPRSTSRPAA